MKRRKPAERRLGITFEWRRRRNETDVYNDNESLLNWRSASGQLLLIFTYNPSAEPESVKDWNLSPVQIANNLFFSVVRRRMEYSCNYPSVLISLWAAREISSQSCWFWIRALWMESMFVEFSTYENSLEKKWYLESFHSVFRRELQVTSTFVEQIWKWRGKINYNRGRIGYSNILVSEHCTTGRECLLITDDFFIRHFFRII